MTKKEAVLLKKIGIGVLLIAIVIFFWATVQVYPEQMEIMPDDFYYKVGSAASFFYL